jgi:tetratricopeptide (TPR) repeat protein/O-antigen ligase
MFIDDLKIKKSVKKRTVKTESIVQRAVETVQQVIHPSFLESPEKKKKIELLDNIFEWSLYGFIFLIPLFFSPLTGDILELNKQMLIFLATLFFAVLYISKSILAEKIHIKYSPLYAGFGGLLAAWLIASIFSIYPYNSFLGLEKQACISFSTLLSFGVLTFVVVNNFSARHVPNMILSFLASMTLAILIGLLQIFGIFILPFAVTKTAAFNTIGLTDVWGGLIVVSLLLSLALIIRGSLVQEKYTKLLSVLLSLFTSLCLIALVIVGDRGLWISLIIGLALLLTVLYLRLPQDQKVAWLVLPSFVAVFSITMIFFNPRVVQLPFSAQPSLATSIGISFKTLVDSPLTGYGPGNYITSYTKFRPKEINKANILQLWTVRFDQSGSAILTAIAATGILGLFGMLAVVILLGLLLYRELSTKKIDEDYLLFLGMASTLLTVTILGFIKTANITLVFSAWLLIACILLFTATSLKVIKGSHSNRFLILSSLSLYAILALGLVGGFFAVKRYIADAYMAQGLVLDQKLSGFTQAGKDIPIPDVDALIQKFSSAAAIDSAHHGYSRLVSQALVYKLSTLAKDTAHVQQNLSVIQSTASTAVDAAKRAVSIFPHDVRNLQNLAVTYQAIAPYADGADAFITESYNKAISLDPSNPLLLVEFAKARLDVAAFHTAKANQTKDESTKSNEQSMAQTTLGDAEKNLKSAIALKSDYPDAYLYLGIAYAQMNNKVDALQNFDLAKDVNLKLAQIQSASETLFYLLGLGYNSFNQKDKAEESFKYAIALKPDYQLARWQYGLMLADMENRKEDGITMFESILNYDPNNQIVINKVHELRTGKQSETTPTSTPAPAVIQPASTQPEPQQQSIAPADSQTEEPANTEPPTSEEKE